MWISLDHRLIPIDTHLALASIVQILETVEDEESSLPRHKSIELEDEFIPPFPPFSPFPPFPPLDFNHFEPVKKPDLTSISEVNIVNENAFRC